MIVAGVIIFAAILNLIILLIFAEAVERRREHSEE